MGHRVQIRQEGRQINKLSHQMHANTIINKI